MARGDDAFNERVYCRTSSHCCIQDTAVLQSILDRPDYRYYNSSKPYVLLSPHFQSIFREYVVDGESRRGHKAMGEYHIPVSEFLLMLQNDGIASLTDIDISHIVRICNFFDDKERCDYTKRKSKQAVSDFLIHMCADCLPWCYRYYASEIRKSSYIPILDQNLLSVFPRVDKPSASLEEPFEKFAAKWKSADIYMDLWPQRNMSLYISFSTLSLTR